MYHQSPTSLPYTWSDPNSPASGQTHQPLQGIPHQSTYPSPLNDQSYPSQYYHYVDSLSRHLLPPLSPHSAHLSVSSFPHESWHSQLYYPPFQCPPSSPNYFQYNDSFRPLIQQPFPYEISKHPDNLKRLDHDIVTNPDGTKTPASIKPPVLRGPPRKARQSGHALWVGNLPPSTDIMKLKEHFSAGATAAIESVFWISKSKSAFVNYKTAEALSDAVKRFHQSKFEGVRLACRVRRAIIPTPVAAAAATAIVGPWDNKNQDYLSLTVGDSVETTNSEGSSPKSLRASDVNMKPPLENNAKKRFFIMKSLTTEDLESSVQNRHWVTQEHNETTLNEAFVSADDVYLIFSANKSGEYFGYARMQGLITGQSARPRSIRPAEDASKKCEYDTAETVFTPGTECAPEGAVFIDAYRGIIFWEADLACKDDSSPKLLSATHDPKDSGETADPVKVKEREVSSPFEVEWVSTYRLPFYRTRGLRNPWNANRDVKVARDGTELETNLGIRLLELFHQPMLSVFWDSNGYRTVGF